MSRNKALFLDRDGILMEDLGYVGNPDDVHLIEGGRSTLQWAQAHGYKLIVLTNQSGVARGKFTLQEVDMVNHRLVQEWELRGVKLDDVFVCPTLDGEDRKPRPGLVLKAEAKHHIDLSRSLMVGDKDSDVIEHAELKTILIRGNYPITKTDRLGSWTDVESFLNKQA